MGTNALRTVSLLAAETDFSEPGDLSLFIDETALTFLEDVMWLRGVPGLQADGGRLPALAPQRSDLVAGGA